MRTTQATAVWEYREFDIPEVDREKALLSWMREGWELIGLHPKGKGQRKPIPVAIMRREYAFASNKGDASARAS
jgi:hypothetical protein